MRLYPSSHAKELDKNSITMPEKKVHARKLEFFDRLTFVESRNVKNTSRPKLKNKEKTRDISEMTAQIRRYCVIVANCKFTNNPNMEPLHGYLNDLTHLSKVFRQLYFQVQPFYIKTGAEIKEISKEYSNMTLKHNGYNIEPNAFVGNVLSHGGNEVMYGVSDSQSSPNQTTPDALVAILNNANRPKLQHKPKMLFIQACRGGKSYISVFKRVTMK